MAEKVKYPHIPHEKGADRGTEISAHYHESREQINEQEKKDLARVILPDIQKLQRETEQIKNKIFREFQKVYGNTPIGYSIFGSIAGGITAGPEEALDTLNKIIER
jgi:hypothetical protein